MLIIVVNLNLEPTQFIGVNPTSPFRVLLGRFYAILALTTEVCYQATNAYAPLFCTIVQTTKSDSIPFS